MALQRILAQMLNLESRSETPLDQRVAPAVG
jgi:hypothetical protein